MQHDVRSSHAKSDSVCIHVADGDIYMSRLCLRRYYAGPIPVFFLVHFPA
jgi:hypothetical protein